MTAVTPRRAGSTLDIETASAICQWCGASASGADLVSWAFGREHGRVQHACPSCVRDHLHQIETHYFD